ncbi:MAG: V-type ATP synthase subunit D [Candidatus Bipolaricaulia bacterium]
MSESINATRDVLLRTRQELDTAKEGKDILEKKKEALLSRFLDMIKRYKGKREELLDDLKYLEDTIFFARARDGGVAVSSVAMATGQDVELEIETDNVMGTKIFNMAHPEMSRDLLSRGYNPASTSSRIEAVAGTAESLMDKMLDIAHLEHNIKTVGKEMGTLNRKINALEETIIPDLENTISYITDALEQNEREEIFRLKMVKRIQARKAAEAEAAKDAADAEASTDGRRSK